MKKIMLVLVGIVILSGCTTTLKKVERKYGPPARVEIDCIAGVVCDDNTYYKNRDAVEYIYWFYYWKDWRQQEYCWEIKADKNGNIVSRREYYEQGDKLRPGRAIQPKGRKLPGVE